MLTPDEFKIIMLNYAEQVKYYDKEIRKARANLRMLRIQRKEWQRKQESLCHTELSTEYEPDFKVEEIKAS